MPRPTKAVADYFPHFAQYGKTIPILEKRYGESGYVVWFKTLEILTRTENHYIDCSNVNTWEFYLSSIAIVNEEKINQILNLTAELNAIEKGMWVDYRIIYSDNLVCNLSPLYSRRHVKPFSKEDIIKIVTNTEGEKLTSISKAEPEVEVIIDASKKPRTTTAIATKDGVTKIAKPPEADYISELIALFSKAYFETKHLEYIVTVGKDRKAMGSILSIFKKKFPDDDKETMSEKMYAFFKASCKVEQNEYLKTITITKLYGSINEYISYSSQRIKGDTKYNILRETLDNSGV